jgi:hypothetical protein
MDVFDNESVEDEVNLMRTLVYSVDVKDLVCDNDHKTIEKTPKIERIMKDAIRFLSYVPSIAHPGVRSNCCEDPFVCHCNNLVFVLCLLKDDTREKVQTETEFFPWEKNKPMMKNKLKELLGDIPLEIENRVTLIHLNTIRFARLKTHEYKAVS